MMISFTILCLTFFASLIGAFPLERRDVFNPPISSPNANTVWTVGEKVTVTWDTSNMPPDSQLTRTDGTVLLGFLENGSENLMIDSPLAKGFQLRDGQVSVTVPNVPPRSNYIVVVMGDSGNASPEFTIKGGTAGSSSAATTPSSAPSPSSLISTPVPITGSVLPPSLSSTTTTPSAATTTIPSGSITSASTPSAASTSGTALPAAGNSNSALGIKAVKAICFGSASLVLLTIL